MGYKLYEEKLKGINKRINDILDSPKTVIPEEIENLQNQRAAVERALANIGHGIIWAVKLNTKETVFVNARDPDDVLYAVAKLTTNEEITELVPLPVMKILTSKEVKKILGNFY